MSAKVTDVDRGLNAVAARLAQKCRVRVGILSDAPKEVREGEKPPPYTLLQVAAVHEFGAPEANIPQRTFVRGTVDARIGDIHAAQATLGRQIVEDKVTGETAMERLGAVCQGLMQQQLARGIAPALSPKTIAAKGSSKPLVDTGQLRSSITYVVEKAR